MPTSRGEPIEIVVAIADNGVIGKDGQLPWRLPADLRFFRTLTTGHTVIMGRRTFESIGKPLPDRTNVVLSGSMRLEISGESRVFVARTLDDALDAGPPGLTRFVIGGAQVYAAAWKRADRVHLTRVRMHAIGNTIFVPDLAGFVRVSTRDQEADERNACAMTFEVYARAEWNG
jgi:dihydrofolate reductase